MPHLMPITLITWLQYLCKIMIQTASRKRPQTTASFQKNLLIAQAKLRVLQKNVLFGHFEHFTFWPMTSIPNVKCVLKMIRMPHLMPITLITLLKDLCKIVIQTANHKRPQPTAGFQKNLLITQAKLRVLSSHGEATCA